MRQKEDSPLSRLEWKESIRRRSATDGDGKMLELQFCFFFLLLFFFTVHALTFASSCPSLSSFPSLSLLTRESCRTNDGTGKNRNQVGDRRRYTGKGKKEEEAAKNINDSKSMYEWKRQKHDIQRQPQQPDRDYTPERTAQTGRRRRQKSEATKRSGNRRCRFRCQQNRSLSTYTPSSFSHEEEDGNKKSMPLLLVLLLLLHRIKRQKKTDLTFFLLLPFPSPPLTLDRCLATSIRWHLLHV